MSVLAQQEGSGGGFNILQSLQSGFTVFVSYLPQVIGALVVLIIGYIIARILRSVITKLLRRVKLDDRLTHGSGGEYVARFSPQGSPALLVGTVVYVVIMVFVVISAVGTLNIPAVSGFVSLVLSYLPNVIAALLIFLVAAAVAAAVGGLVHRTMGDTPTGRIARTAAPTLVMAIAVFMVLDQLGIAQTIVTATYIALIGSVALGAALAFGLGGRDAAAELINSGYRRAQDQTDQIKSDIATGRDRGQAEAQRLQQQHGAPGGQPGNPAQQTTEIPPQTGEVYSPQGYGSEGQTQGGYGQPGYAQPGYAQEGYGQDLGGQEPGARRI